MALKIGIYKITNPKEKIYIGQSINISRRLYEYKSLSNSIKGQTKIYRSLLKYGVENHIFELIEECTLNNIDERELYWKLYYNTIKDGLNCRLNDKKGGPLSSETRKNMSLAAMGFSNFKGKTHSEKSKQLKSESMKGKKFHTNESKLAISKGQKNRKIDYAERSRKYWIKKNRDISWEL